MVCDLGCCVWHGGDSNRGSVVATSFLAATRLEYTVVEGFLGVERVNNICSGVCTIRPVEDGLAWGVSHTSLHRVQVQRYRRFYSEGVALWRNSLWLVMCWIVVLPMMGTHQKF